MAMNKEYTRLGKLIHFIDDLDDLGGFTGGATALTVIFGTLRKDKSLASDIYTIASSQNDGLGIVALSRILVEDYIYLSYLIRSEDNRQALLKDFDNHPAVESYLSILAMREWGFQFDGSPETAAMLFKAKAKFQVHKDAFLRRKPIKGSINADDYYRTWTKMNLNDVIKKSGIVNSSDRKELQTSKQVYDAGSGVIHHNAFLIWNLSRVGTELISESYPKLGIGVSVSTLAKIIQLAIEVKYSGDDKKYTETLNRLSDILE